MTIQMCAAVNNVQCFNVFVHCMLLVCACALMHACVHLNLLSFLLFQSSSVTQQCHSVYEGLHVTLYFMHVHMQYIQYYMYRLDTF